VPEYKSKPYSHVFRILLILIIVGVVGVAVRAMVLPKSFGEYGHYRGTAIEDEMNRPIRNGTNASCLACHPYIREMHMEGVHKTVSCEFCHGPVADHVKDGKVIARLPKKQGKDYVMACPFHEDDTPSLVVSPDTNLWHCMGACQTGGSVI